MRQPLPLNHPVVELRETCQAADITVKAANDSTRDSIFRSAVNMALKASLQETNTKLAGLKPQQFVAGLAKDLGAHKPFSGVPEIYAQQNLSSPSGMHQMA